MKNNLYLLLCMVFAIGFPFPVLSQIITTVAGSGGTGYGGDGMAAVSATFNSPTAIATDASGNIYISDQVNNCVRMVTPSGIITTIAGQGPASAGHTGDGGPATGAELSANWGIAIDAAGNIYIADQNNNCVRKINNGGFISTIAGTGVAGFSGDGQPATDAQLHAPIGIAVDGAGNVYVGDASNFRIREINTSGFINTIAGNGIPGVGGDGGPALSASLGEIFGMCTDPFGDLYFCDYDTPYSRVRMIDASGLITTVAGVSASGYNGDGINATTAELNLPTAVYSSAAGELYIADYYNNRIRKVNSSGIINTVAGTGSPGFMGDGNLAVNAQLHNPIYVTMNNDNSIIYLTDYINVRIRMISDQNVVYFTGGHSQSLSVCENTTNDPLNSQLTILDHEVGLTDNWGLLSGPLHGFAAVTYSVTATGADYTPTGLYYTPDGGYSGGDTLEVTINDSLGADTTTIYINIYPTEPYAGAIDGPSNVCVGATITLSESVTGGAWSSENTTVLLAGSVITGEHPGADVITYTVSNPCGSSSVFKTIAIDSLPDPGYISGIAEMCIGDSATLTDAQTGGIWNISNGLAVIEPTATAGVVTGIGRGTDTVTYTVTNGLCEADTSLVVTIDSFPYAGNISGGPDVCMGASIRLSDLVGGGVWGISNSDLFLSGDTLTGVSTGADTVIYSVTNMCGADSATTIIAVEPLPPQPVISQNESVLSIPYGYISYQWTLNGKMITGAIADTYTTQTAGLYAVTVLNSFGCAVTSPSLTVYGCSPGDIRIYPNPTTDKVYINWCKFLSVRVMTEDGRIVTEMDRTNEADIGLLPNGNYVLSVYDANGNTLKSMLITKISK